MCVLGYNIFKFDFHICNHSVTIRVKDPFGIWILFHCIFHEVNLSPTHWNMIFGNWWILCDEFETTYFIPAICGIVKCVSTLFTVYLLVLVKRPLREWFK